MDAAHRGAAYADAMRVIDGSIDRANKFHAAMSGLAEAAVGSADISAHPAPFNGALRDYQIEGGDWLPMADALYWSHAASRPTI